MVQLGASGRAGRQGACSSELTRTNPEEHLNMSLSSTLLSVSSNPQTNPAIQRDTAYSFMAQRKETNHL